MSGATIGIGVVCTAAITCVIMLVITKSILAGLGSAALVLFATFVTTAVAIVAAIACVMVTVTTRNTFTGIGSAALVMVSAFIINYIGVNYPVLQ